MSIEADRENNPFQRPPIASYDRLHPFVNKFVEGGGRVDGTFFGHDINKITDPVALLAIIDYFAKELAQERKERENERVFYELRKKVAEVWHRDNY